jgi:hypothetical protein
MLSRVIGLLDVGVLANVINANPQMTSDLIPLLAPEVGAGLGAGVSANPALLVETLNALNPAILANALNAHPEISKRLSEVLSPDLGQPIAQGVSANPAFLGELLKNLDPAPIAAALAAHTDFVKSLLTQITPGVVAPMIRGSNRNPAFLSSLISHLSPVTLAGAVNDNPAFLKSLLTNLGGSLGTASAQGLGKDFLSALIGALNPAVIAGAVNANPTFLTDFLAATDPLVAQFLAEGINQNVATHPLGQDMLSVMIANVSGTAAQALAEGINQNVALHGTSDNFLTALLTNTSGDTGLAMANGINNNPTFVQTLVANVDQNTAIAAANALNLSSYRAIHGTAEHPPAYYQFLHKLLANLGPEAAKAGSQGLDNNPQLDPLILGLVSNLNATDVASVIAQGVNANAASQTMIKAVMDKLSANTAQTIALALNANPDMTRFLLKYLNPDTLAAVVNQNAILQPKSSPTDAGNFLAGLISNLDGSVIASAMNDEYTQTGSSLIYRLLTSPDMNGANLANTLNYYGSNMLLGLINNLDGKMVADAINNNPGAKTFLTNLVAYLDPYQLTNLTKQSNADGFMKAVWFYIWVYWTNLAGPAPSTLTFKILDAGVWIPPDSPPYPQ